MSTPRHDFLRSYQEDSGLARSMGGLGIGLTLVKQLTELHGGRVTASSEGPGRGSEFVVHLPASATSATGGVEAGPSASPRALRILVVEDNPDTAEAFSLQLELGGHRVRVAFDGASALSLVDEFCPDVSFIDIGLPGMDGYELVGRLRRHPRCRIGLFVALSGYGRQQDQLHATQAGFDQHLTKPVDPDVVERILLNMSPRP